MPTIGPMESIVVLVITLLILGPHRLSAAGRSLGRGITEFKNGLAGGDTTPAASTHPALPQPAVPPAADAPGSETAGTTPPT
jgi:sec-independent protein translocase protein TatA